MLQRIDFYPKTHSFVNIVDELIQEGYDSPWKIPEEVIPEFLCKFFTDYTIDPFLEYMTMEDALIMKKSSFEPLSKEESTPLYQRIMKYNEPYFQSIFDERWNYVQAEMDQYCSEQEVGAYNASL